MSQRQKKLVNTPKNKLSGANVEENAFTMLRNSMRDAPDEVVFWLKEIGILN